MSLWYCSRPASRGCRWWRCPCAKIRLRIGVKVGIHVLLYTAVGKATVSEVLIEVMPNFRGEMLFDSVERLVQ